jgi:hypothetical protein
VPKCPSRVQHAGDSLFRGEVSTAHLVHHSSLSSFAASVLRRMPIVACERRLRVMW